MIAANEGHLSMIKLLLEEGADVHLQVSIAQIVFQQTSNNNYTNKTNINSNKKLNQTNFLLINRMMMAVLHCFMLRDMI